MVIEMLVYTPFDHLTWRLAQQHCIEFGHYESFKLCNIVLYRVDIWLFVFV
jgi:hypothetical protein